MHITQCTMQTIALMYYADNTFNFKKVGAENSEFLVCMSVCQFSTILMKSWAFPVPNIFSDISGIFLHKFH